MKQHLLLALIPLVSGTAAPPPTDSSTAEISKSCTSYAQALEVLHILDQGGDRGVNVVQGRRGVKVGDVWGIVWKGEGMSSGNEENPLRSFFRAITSTLHKAYLILLLILHTPLYGFLGIDVLSTLTPATTSQLPQLQGATPDGRRLVQLLEEATSGEACGGAWAMRGVVALLPPDGIEPDLSLAFRSFQKSTAESANSTAQFMQGFMHAAGLRSTEQDQAKALLEYTFAAMQGMPAAELALGYRYWSGIGVRDDCMASLDWYQNAAEKAYEHFLSGPPGGRTLPLQPTRLSDLSGGVYGYGASWASTGMNVNRAGIKAGNSVAGGETFEDVIEYYRFQSEREVHKSTVALGRIYYFGSVYPQSGGLVSGAEAVGAVTQDFAKARLYFLRAARALWPTDPVDLATSTSSLDGQSLPAGFDAKVGQKPMSAEAYDALAQSAGTAAGMLGRMYMRAEGVPRNFLLAHMWLKRAADIGDREARNLLGIAYRDGLGVERKTATALHLFSAAAGADLAEAHIQLGKMHASETDPKKQGQAVQAWSQALALGNNFEAFYHLGRMHAQEARTQGTGSKKKSGTCGVAVAYFKTVAERGSWQYPYMRDAERAWARGERAKALISWWIAGEMGYETAQNNVAFILDQERNASRRKSMLSGNDRLDVAENASLSALTHWIRSAGQSNVDALVKVGDYYYDRVGVKGHEDPYEKAIGAYQSAADTQASAMAFWNLGWMYENGLGVPQDWHLAKRFYDLCKQTNAEAHWPVTLSLLKLHLRSWWSSFLGGKQEHLAWFAPATQQRLPDYGADESVDRLEIERELAQEEDMDVVAWARSRARDELDDTYDDYLETGRSHRRNRRQDSTTDEGGSSFGGDDDDEDDINDTAMIGVLVAGLTAAFWLRARQVRLRQEREEAEARARGEPVPPRVEADIARPGLDFPPVPI